MKIIETGSVANVAVSLLCSQGSALPRPQSSNPNAGSPQRKRIFKSVRYMVYLCSHIVYVAVLQIWRVSITGSHNRGAYSPACSCWGRLLIINAPLLLCSMRAASVSTSPGKTADTPPQFPRQPVPLPRHLIHGPPCGLP